MTDPKLSSRRADGMPEPAALPTEGAGAVSDAVIRRIGASLLAGNTPGIAIIMGSADCAAHVSVLTGIYSAMGLAVFAAAEADADACPDVVHVGAGCTGLRNALQALRRMAEIFCGVSRSGDAAQLKQGLSRLPAFFNVPLYPDEAAETLLRPAETLGIPVLRELGAETEPAALAKKSLETANIRLKPKFPMLPTAYGSEFEGERVREPDCAAEFYPVCELVTAAEHTAVEDHRIAVIGDDRLPDVGAAMQLAVLVEVSGGKMQPDFEAVIEHQIHKWLSWIAGAEHRGRRDSVCLRLDRTAARSGLTLTGLAEVIYYGVRTEFAPVAEKCQITIMTDAAASEHFTKTVALPRYRERDARLASLTDENTDTFYSCTTCQSIAPRHCCVVTPERCGMCGALTWPDAKAAFELNPAGPNRPILHGQARDGLYGKFDAVDCAAEKATAGAVTELSLYSLMDSPRTGCGRLECICCVEPVSGGVILVDRDYPGMTPAGMTFENLADMVFGGVQMPGFLGVAKQYITSRKFLRAEGGALRIVWMTQKLKEELADRLNGTVGELFGIENFCGMVADERIAEDPETLYAFLAEKQHPVLTMEPIL